MRTFLILGLATLNLLIQAAPPTLADQPHSISKIAFGSCYGKKHGTPKIWEHVLADSPDLWVWLGDNVYADPKHDVPASSKEEIAQAYTRTFDDDLLYAKLSQSTPVIATWDDHDYGKNDGGAEYPLKEKSKEVFLDFFQEPQDSPRRTRPGVYTSYTFGPPEQRIQILLLDLRTFRSALKVGKRRKNPYGGAFLPNKDQNATILGEAQWAWLKTELEKPATLRLLCSSIQCISEFDGWEAWANFPAEKEKLITLIKETRAEGLLILSGDSHKAELHLQEPDECYPLWDLTSSGVNQGLRHTESQTLCGKSYGKPNYGLLTVDWEQQVVQMEIKGTHGNIALSHLLPFSQLTFHPENLSPAPLKNTLGDWTHKHGSFQIKEEAGLYTGSYTYKGEQGSLNLSVRGQKLEGTWERKGATRKCQFTPTRSGQYLQATHSKSLSTDPLWDWNGWKETSKKPLY